MLLFVAVITYELTSLLAAFATVIYKTGAMNTDPQPITELYHWPWLYEPFSAISHLLGAAAFLILGLALLKRGSGSKGQYQGKTLAGRLVSLSIYAGSCVALLLASTAFHMFEKGGSIGRVAERLDHVAIYLLIAGTFTPTYVILFHGKRRWVPLTLIWAVATLGISLKTFFFDYISDWVSLAFYLAMGWMGVFTVGAIWKRNSFRYIQLMVWGGLSYTAGAIICYFEQLVIWPGVIHAHEIFHITVLVGALLHWRFIWQIATDEAYA